MKIRIKDRKNRENSFTKFFSLLTYFFVISLIISTGCHKNPTGDGETYDPRNITRNPSSKANPSMCIDINGTVHLVWSDDTPGNKEIFYSFKPEGGKWATSTNISKNEAESSCPDIASDPSNNLHVVWDEGGASSEIMYSAKEGTGDWSNAMNISKTNGGSDLPDVDCDSYGTIYVIWMYGLGLGFCQKKNGNWSTSEIFSSYSEMNPSCSVSDDGVLYVVGESDLPYGNNEIYFYKRDTDGNWSEPENISNSPDYYSYLPEVVCDNNGNVFTSWCESIQGYSDIFFSECSLGGSWSEPENISNTPMISSLWISMDIDISGNIHLVYTKDTGIDYDIIYKMRDLNGNWIEGENISQSDELSAAPVIRVKDGIIHIAWIEGPQFEWDVYYIEKSY